MKYRILSLESAYKEQLHTVGNKILNLSKAKNKGFNVLPGYVLIPFKTGNYLEAIIPEIDFSLPWIVRSSSLNEDTDEFSYAGIYESIKINSVEELKNTLKKIRLSNKLDEAQYNENMAFLIQPYKNFKCGGVLFTPNPWDLSSHYVEIATPESVTQGEVSNINNNCVTQEEISNLSQKINEVFDYEYKDVEWGKYNNTIFILQIRSLNKALPYNLRYGIWIRDFHHNPLPLSFAHKTLIEYIDTIYPGFLAVFRNYLYYPKQVPRIKKTDKLPFDSDLFEKFADFVVEYIYNSYKSSGKDIVGSDNLLVSAAKVFWAYLLKKGNTKLDSKEVQPFFYNEFLEIVGYLPENWDISSPVLFERKIYVLKFLEDIKNTYEDEIRYIEKTSKKTIDFKVFFEEYSQISNSEKDDLNFAKEMYKIKYLYMNIGSKLQHKKIIKNISDVYFLSVKEISDFEKSNKNLDSSQIIRKIQHRKLLQNNKNIIIPEQFINGIPKYKTFQNISNTTQYQGFPLSNGKVSAYAYDLKDVEVYTSKTNYILLAHSIKPQDIIYVIKANGLVVESENRASHILIMAMELNIPVVVGIENAIEIFNGRKILLDGENGKVQIIEF